ncbi:hypothetical protein ACFQ88_22390 [Paenibacillus sp. NPDC056579]|uniref:hypothetical protein n=1 Tax=Paenibacillus sp. NPDC056579 TaxID=3345871 RepID=UPI0036B3FAE4
MDNFVCVVCGYDKLDVPQWNKNGFPTHSICCCCGFQSGFDDDAKDNPETIEEYRNRWLRNGAIWFSSTVSKPNNWDIKKQLVNIDVIL